MTTVARMGRHDRRGTAVVSARPCEMQGPYHLDMQHSPVGGVRTGYFAVGSRRKPCSGTSALLPAGTSVRPGPLPRVVCSWASGLKPEMAPSPRAVDNGP